MSPRREQQWWDRWFLKLAQHISTASKDPSTKVGAVIVDSERRIVSAGYNGFARGVEDTPERLNHRETKYKLVVHAERNAIIFARQNLVGCTLYTYPFMPCAACAGMVIQSGIRSVISLANDNPRWQEDFRLTERSFVEAGVRLGLLDTLEEPRKLRGPCCDECHAAADGRDPNDCGGCP